MDTDWTHEQNVPEEKPNFWKLFQDGAFERGEVKDPILCDMYDNLMRESMGTCNSAGVRISD